MFYFTVNMHVLIIPLFTAQKLGFVEAPELLLSDKEWKDIKEKSNARQDSSQPCVICKEDFGLQQQVTLVSSLKVVNCISQ